jgi:hypothetical protein
MKKEMIWQNEQLQDLFKYLKEAGLDDIVFAVLGGILSRYEELWENARLTCKMAKTRDTSLGLTCVLRFMLQSNSSRHLMEMTTLLLQN